MFDFFTWNVPFDLFCMTLIPLAFIFLYQMSNEAQFIFLVFVHVFFAVIGGLLLGDALRRGQFEVGGFLMLAFGMLYTLAINGAYRDANRMRQKAKEEAAQARERAPRVDSTAFTASPVETPGGVQSAVEAGKNP